MISLLPTLALVWGSLRFSPLLLYWAVESKLRAREFSEGDGGHASGIISCKCWSVGHCRASILSELKVGGRSYALIQLPLEIVMCSTSIWTYATPIALM